MGWGCTSFDHILLDTKGDSSSVVTAEAWKDNGVKIDQERAGCKTKEHASKAYIDAALDFINNYKE